MALSQKAVDKSLGNNRLIGRLMTHFDRHFETIRRWILNREERLTTPAPLQIFREELGLTDSEILQESSVPA